MTDYDKVITPGGSGKIVAKIDTESLKGKFQKNITVHSNSVKNSKFILGCSGVAQSWYELTPGHGLSFGRVLPGKEAEMEITICPKPNDHFNIVKVENSFAHLRTEIVPLGEKGEGYILKAKIDADAPVGRFGDHIMVHTDRPTPNPVIKVPVWAGIFGPISFFPNRLVVQRNEPGQSVTATLYSSGKSRFKIRSVHTPKGYTSEITEAKEGEKYFVKVTLQEPVINSADLEITIKTDNPEQPVITIPLQTKKEEKGQD